MKSPHINKPRRKILNKRTALMTVILLFVVGMFIPLNHTGYKTKQIPFETVATTDANLELGESMTDKEGVEGEKVITIETKRSLFDLLFRKNSIKTVEVSSEIIKESSPKVIVNGNRKYQYMYCSDGSYRFYTDEQFMDANTGFTSKSEDNCAQNGNGTKVGLGDSPNSNTSVAAVPRSSNYSTGLTANPPEMQPYNTTVDGNIPNIKTSPRPPTSGAGMTFQQVYDYCRTRLLSGAISGQSGFTSCMNQGGF